MGLKIQYFPVFQIMNLFDFKKGNSKGLFFLFFPNFSHTIRCFLPRQHLFTSFPEPSFPALVVKNGIV